LKDSQVEQGNCGSASQVSVVVVVHEEKCCWGRSFLNKERKNRCEESEMEPLNQKSIERVVSQKALQMGNSFPCQICVVGFLCGVCLTSLFLAALTSFGSFQFGPILFSTMSMANSSGNSTFPNDISKSISFSFL